ncbi:hypothetical protein [Nocardia fluminea]
MTAAVSMTGPAVACGATMVTTAANAVAVVARRRFIGRVMFMAGR